MNDTKEQTTIAKILSNTHRYAMIELLINRSDEDLCVNQIADAVGISQPLASHQLSYLESHDIVTGERIGQTTCYSLTDSDRTKKIIRITKILS